LAEKSAAAAAASAVAARCEAAAAAALAAAAAVALAAEQGLTLVHFSAQSKPFRSASRFVSSL